VILASTDPVAMDRIGYDIIAEKRVAEGLQKKPTPKVLTFLTAATKLGLGISEKEKIDVRFINFG
jgi:uncharacterized Fe-S center protein